MLAMQRIANVLVVFLLVMAVVAQASQQSPNSSQSSKKQNVTHEKIENGSENPLASISQSIHEENAKDGEAQPNNGWLDKLFSDPVATFAALLFFANLALWFTTQKIAIDARELGEIELAPYISVEIH